VVEHSNNFLVLCYSAKNENNNHHQQCNNNNNHNNKSRNNDCCIIIQLVCFGVTDKEERLAPDDRC